jgi:hypothetical protein
MKEVSPFRQLLAVLVTYPKLPRLSPDLTEAFISIQQLRMPSIQAPDNHGG